MKIFRIVVTLTVLVAIWQGIVWFAKTPHYILPGPGRVFSTLIDNIPLIASHAWYTFAEILLGLAIGTCFGVTSALIMTRFAPARRWLLPVLVVSQALPVFALAPMLVLWLGYGMGSKVAMAVLIIFFPVTAACYDGLRHTNSGWIDLARTMGASRSAVIRNIRLPAALPALASGLRIAAAVAPIGAVVGEWVGSSKGLGYLMLHANARMQIDLMFASLLTLAVFAVALYFSIDWLMKRLLNWHPETLSRL